MRSMSSLLHKVRTDFPHIQLQAGDHFAWLPKTSTVLYNSDEPHREALLLHELSHSVLGHVTYHRDVELLSMEAAAWEKARALASAYNVAIDSDLAEDNLDTYREWLHARSTCPVCTATGYQSGKNIYSCVACSNQWSVNEARLCGLKRYNLKKTTD